MTVDALSKTRKPPKRVYVVLYQDGIPLGVTVLKSEAMQWTREEQALGPFVYELVSPKRSKT